MPCCFFFSYSVQGGLFYMILWGFYFNVWLPGAEGFCWSALFYFVLFYFVLFYTKQNPYPQLLYTNCSLTKKWVQFSTVLGLGILSSQNSDRGLVRNLLGVLIHITVAAERLAWNDLLPKLYYFPLQYKLIESRDIAENVKFAFVFHLGWCYMPCSNWDV